MGGLTLKSGKNCPEYQQNRFKNLNLKIFRTAMVLNIILKQLMQERKCQ